MSKAEKHVSNHAFRVNAYSDYWETEMSLNISLPGKFAGMSVQIVDAQKQARTARDVRGPWVRPRCRSKAAGRRGTRRAWKRKNAPHYVMLYREPSDVLVIHGRTIIATPQQAGALRRETIKRVWDTRPGSAW